MTKQTQRALVEDIATRVSETAYMAYAFDAGMYRSIARFLLAQGFSPAEAEAIMDSKHVRWAADESYSRISGNTFKRYFERRRQNIARDVAEWGDDGTINFYRGRQSAFWTARKS